MSAIDRLPFILSPKYVAAIVGDDSRVVSAMGLFFVFVPSDAAEVPRKRRVHH
jgi:hypothetical protein